MVPLFSIPSSRSWGIGEIADLELLARWLESAGQRLLQLLPINETPPDEASPYSALSAMALDPQFVSLDQVEDFMAIGGERVLEPDLRAELERVRAGSAVDYTSVRALKAAAFRRSFTQFREKEWLTGSRRAAAFKEYIAREAWWLNEYALFRALHYHFGCPWTNWPEALNTRQQPALDLARINLANEILFREYLQWIAESQWDDVRERAAAVSLVGDMPFTVGTDSADVWARQQEFRLDASVGVPPDAFSETGQDWGLPVPRWDRMADGDFEWLRQRGRRAAALFDGYRVDHLVGFYRTYYRPHDGSDPHFTPSDEPSQLALGERVLASLRAEAGEMIAEDLGTVPEFVRDSLLRLGIPGLKVFRWERHWHVEGQPFKDPADYPVTAVATTGTHDTVPLVTWWEEASGEEREAVLAVPSLRERMTDAQRAEAISATQLPDAAGEAIIEALYASRSNTLILPVQDVFGWRDRINRPATQSDYNWRWRLPWASNRLSSDADATRVAERLRRLCLQYER
jgi:4-alpha-glucanotransferase